MNNELHHLCKLHWTFDLYRLLVEFDLSFNITGMEIQKELS